MNEDVAHRAKKSGYLVFGVQPGRAPYRLRQARYVALAEDVSRFIISNKLEKVRLLDVGVHSGVSRRYLEVQPGAERIDYHAVDIYPRGPEFVYKHADWTLHFADLEFGLPQFGKAEFDVIICEQVLEHLH